MGQILKGYKAKLYPTKAQEQALLQYIGGSRFIYNYLLDLKTTVYRDAGKNMNFQALSKEVKWLRREFSWLTDVPADILNQSVRNLDAAFRNFFRNTAAYPVFKRKHSKQRFRKPRGWRTEGSRIFISEAIDVRFRGDFPVRGKILTVSKEANGSWWISTALEENRDSSELKDDCLGVDLGLMHLAITSDGDKYENLRVMSGLDKRIKAASQALSRTRKGSRRRAKARLRLARLHQKVANVRKNHLHHVSKAIVGKNHATIAVEDLGVRGMVKNRKLAKSITNASWGELVRQLTYKQAWNGGRTVKIDRFYPSSKTCHDCHYVAPKIPLELREWECPKCLMKHDRDVNAAKVIKAAGERLCVEGTEGTRKIRLVRKITGPTKRGSDREIKIPINKANGPRL